MHSDKFLREITAAIKSGPPLHSVVLTRMPEYGAGGLALLARRKGAGSIETLATWFVGPETDAHALYDEVFDLTYECIHRLLGAQGQLF